MSSFSDLHQEWLNKHLKKRKGERKSRLQRGHGHGEQLFLERVWWPLFGHFHNLHPEYEVVDWRGHPYFVDFVWMRGQCRFAIEIKGYGPHVQDTDRIRYRRELNRELFLQSLGYRVLSIPYDDLENSPQVTQFLMKSLLAPYMNTNFDREYSIIEGEILKMTHYQIKPIRPVDVSNKLGINKRTAVKHLKNLCSKGKLKPIISGKSERITRYESTTTISDHVYW